jgi:hypothetical protein
MLCTVFDIERCERWLEGNLLLDGLREDSFWCTIYNPVLGFLFARPFFLPAAVHLHRRA